MPIQRIIVSLLGLWINCLFSLPAAAFQEVSPWQEFLNQNLKNGHVNYSAVQNGSALLNAVIAQLENVKQEDYAQWSYDEKKAFWINAYNVTAVKLVVDHYPLKRSLGLQAFRYPAKSIQQIPDVWNQDTLIILGKTMSLNQIENEILRKEFQDPRIHFAIVCASLGCPVLRGEPYTADQLDRQLDDQVLQFLQDPKKFRYDSAKIELYLSPIFKWFKEDFTAGPTAFIKKYWPGISENAKIRWLQYDWTLNEQ